MCRQFERNSRYESRSDDGFEIAESEDISYEMTVHDKRYEAAFFQLSDLDKDTIAMRDHAKKKVMSQLKVNQIDDDSFAESMVNLQMVAERLRYMTRSVWFMIGEQYGRYYIIMYYDNEMNKANGEDL